MSTATILLLLQLVLIWASYELGSVLTRRRVMRELGPELDAEFARGLKRGREQRTEPEEEIFRHGVATGLRMPRPCDAKDGQSPPLVRMGAHQPQPPIVIVRREEATV
jgi:hypothetical protein